MKILLTGATGFIGSAFARLALERGHEIMGLALPAERLPAALVNADKVRWARGSLEQAPWSEIGNFSPEVCVHAAWLTTPGVYLESPENERFRDSSIEFLRTAARQAGVSHIVGLGTCIEYELSPRPLSEEATPIRPTTRYAKCKNELRLALEIDSRSHGFGFCWARVFYPYGPGEHPSRLCSSLLEKLARDEKVTLRTPDSTKDYIFIDDLAGALATVVEQRRQGAINLGTGTGVPVREIAETLGALVGKQDLLAYPVPPEADPFPFVVADASRLHQCGWLPRFSLQQGLARLIAARERKSATEG